MINISLYYVPFSDVNECLTIPGLCANGDCINKEGSFKCRCPEGFIMTDDGRSCIGIVVQMSRDM